MAICQGYGVPGLSRQFCEYERNNQSLLSYLRQPLHSLQQIKATSIWMSLLSHNMDMREVGDPMQQDQRGLIT